MATSNPRYGKGVAVVHESEAPPDVAAALRQVFTSPSYKPPIVPKVAFELHRVVREPNLDLARVVRLLESDPMLAAELLKLAQSSFYSRGAPVTSIRDAITRLGLVTTGNLFLQAAMNARVFRAPGFEDLMAKLRVHSVVTANVAGRLALRTSLFEDYAFLCGLLHDVGAAAGLIALGELRGRATMHQDEVGLVRMAVFSAHAELGGIVANIWKLPADVRLVVDNHHQRKVKGFVHPLVAITAVAEAIAHDLGAGIDDEPRDEVGWALEALGLGRYEPLVEDSSKAVAAVLAAA